MPDETAAPTPDPRPGSGPGTAPATPQDGRDRLLASLRRPGSRAQITAGLLMAVLGFAAVVQVQSNSEDASYVGARQDELISLINSLSLASQRAENEIAELEQTRNSLLNDTQARRTALERARQRADELGILAGTMPAVGPGIQVTVRDPDGAVGSNQLINGIQELRDAGAEAIEINDSVRVVASTWFTDEDGQVVVDGEVIKPPYVIDAIGGSHTLGEAVIFRGGLRDMVERDGGTVDIQEADVVEVGSLHTITQPEYAQPTDR
jgi:uncharacterized protein YlxW (UPF0749 family)